MIRIQAILLSAVLLLAGSLFGSPACQAAETPAKPIAITNARIFDGSKVIPSGTVVFQGRTITAAGPKAAVPPGAEVIDGTGATVLPGFVDSHTHTWGDALARAAVFGVTTQLDMFTAPTFAQAMREEQAKTGAPGRADLLSAGFLATAPGGHGTQFGMPVPTLTKPEEAPAWVDARIAEGSDYIKIVAEDSKIYGREIPALGKATIQALVEAAHRRGKLAVVHVSTLQTAKEALEAGADGLVHIFTDKAPDQEFIDLAVRKKAFVIPTLTVVESTTGTASGRSLSEDPRLAPYLKPEEVQGLRSQFPKRELRFQNALEAVRRLAAAGVPILAGSDAPNPGTAHGASIHREIELLVAAGLSPIQALAAATWTPTRAFQLKDRGQIAQGHRADLVLVKGDPTQDVTATRDILKVWKIGQEIPRPKIEAQAAVSAASAAAASSSGEISGFEDGSLATGFGAGWSESTDQMAGGASVVQKEVVSEGANGSGKSLVISGETRPGFAFPWSGMIFFPGARQMAPADLSKFSGVSFWTKGDGRTYQFLLFATRLGRMPASMSFTVGSEWQQVTVPFSDLGLDGSDVMGIFVGGGMPHGTFRFQIDDVRLVPKGGS